jgi:dTDP-4-amino-4,6-dideoxygalactose transaminase
VPFADCAITIDAQRAAQRVLASGWTTTGPEVRAFESEFAAAVHARRAVATSSCTAALELSLRSLHLPPGSGVLTSTMTFCGAVQAIIHADLRPVLVDVDPRTGMVTPETTARASAASGGAAAMVITHIAGDTASVEDLAAAAGLSRRELVEDAAHALGAVADGHPVGSAGTACFSFYATKNLPIGEGGMVTTDDAEKADWLTRARLHGMSRDAWRRYLPGGGWRYDVEEAALKANMPDLEAAIGRCQLQELGRWLDRRAAIAAQYDDALSSLPGLRLPHHPVASDSRHAWHLYPLQITGADRDEVAARLAEQGVGTSVHFIPVHQLSYFRRELDVQTYPGADEWFRGELSLPIYPRLTDEQVAHVCEVIHETLRPRGRHVR